MGPGGWVDGGMAQNIFGGFIFHPQLDQAEWLSPNCEAWVDTLIWSLAVRGWLIGSIWAALTGKEPHHFRGTHIPGDEHRNAC